MHQDFLERLPELAKHADRSPALYLHQIDETGENGLVIDADRAFYRRAIFLDERALSEDSKGAWIPLAGLKELILAGPQPPPRTHFIFHIGHCGSTLVSRLLEEAGGNLALREPLVLRDLSRLRGAAKAGEGPLSESRLEREIEFHARLLGRTFAPDEVAIVKATSYTSDLGPALMALNPDNRALLMAMDAEPYVATMAAAAENRRDLEGFAPARLAALAEQIGPLGIELDSLSAGQLAGLAWTSEIVKLHTIAADHAAQSKLVDFDAFLADPRAKLAEICTFFGLAVDDGGLDQLMRSPVLTSYSKAPDYPFDAAARARRISEARETAANEVDRGSDLIAGLRGRHPRIERAARAFGY